MGSFFISECWILFLEKKSASEKSSVIKRWLRGMKPIHVCMTFHMHTSDSSGDSPLATGWQSYFDGVEV
jgi:hypothetical protein